MDAENTDLTFEDATPVTPEELDAIRGKKPARGRPGTPSRPETALAVGRTLPHSIEAEEYLLSCCLLDGSETIQRCVEARLSDDVFYSPANRVLYGALVELWRAAPPVDIVVLAEELKKSRQLDAVGGFPALTRISGLAPTTAQAQYFLDKVRELHGLRELIKVATGAAESAFEYQGNAAELAADIETRITEVTREMREAQRIEAVPLADFDYPEGDDPNVLLGSDDYLGRGGGMLFVSHAGAGKSSFIMDACMSWGEGEPWLGIRSNGPLTSLIIQGEDSGRYVGKVAASYAHARGIKEGSEKAMRLRNNVIIAKVRGICGPAFFIELERLARKHKPDLVVINPIYIYAQGDITKSEHAQPFLVGLDWVNREEKFGYILVHHTGKPTPKAPNGKRAEVEDWETIYMGFGSSYLANWPRCSALLEPRPKKPGSYWLKLGKAGKNAGVTREVEHGAGTRLEPVTRVACRHAQATMKVGGRDRAVIYWEPDPDDAPDDEKRETPKSGGRARDYDFAEFRAALRNVAGSREKRQGYNTLHRAACNVKDVSKGAFNRMIDEALATGELLKDPDDGKYYLPEPTTTKGKRQA